MLYYNLQTGVIYAGVKYVNNNIDYIKKFVNDNDGTFNEEEITFNCVPPTIDYSIVCDKYTKRIELGDYIIKSKLGYFDVLKQEDFKRRFKPYLHGTNRL